MQYAAPREVVLMLPPNAKPVPPAGPGHWEKIALRRAIVPSEPKRNPARLAAVVPVTRPASRGQTPSPHPPDCGRELAAAMPPAPHLIGPGIGPTVPGLPV